MAVRLSPFSKPTPSSCSAGESKRPLGATNFRNPDAPPRILRFKGWRRNPKNRDRDTGFYGGLLDHAYQRNCIIYPLKCNQCEHFMLLYPTWWWVSYEYIQWSVIIMGCSRCVEPGRQTWSCHFLPPGWFSCLSGSPQPKQAAFPSWWQNESFHWTSHEQPWEFSGKTMYQHLQYHPHTLLNLCSFPILVRPFFQNYAESPDFHGTNQFYPWEKVTVLVPRPSDLLPSNLPRCSSSTWKAVQSFRWANWPSPTPWTPWRFSNFGGLGDLFEKHKHQGHGRVYRTCPRI